jgi:elongator complex protein 2
LVGHEDWVTSLSWLSLVIEKNSRQSGGEVQEQINKLRLFSTSMDRNMVIWAITTGIGAGEIWSPVVRVGDIGGALGGSIGGNLLGFTGGCISPDGTSLLGIGYGGSFHLWTSSSPSEVEFTSGIELVKWQPVSFIGGHFSMVNDIFWSLNGGDYLFSASSDQTCRLFARINNKNDGSSQCWREISRPQIHGYDLNCVLQSSINSFFLFTGGEEKLIRVFDAPNIVLKGLHSLCNIETLKVSCEHNRVDRAYIPELGLSNKAFEVISKQEKDELVN